MSMFEKLSEPVGKMLTTFELKIIEKTRRLLNDQSEARGRRQTKLMMKSLIFDGEKAGRGSRHAFMIQRCESRLLTKPIPSNIFPCDFDEIK